MDDRTVLDQREKAEMRGLVLAGAARADSIRRRRSRIAASVSAVVVVAGIAVGAGFASGALGRGSATPVAPAPSASSSPTSAPESRGENENETWGIVAFERPAAAEDALPAGLTEDGASLLVPETSRYIGEYEDVAYWIAQGRDPYSVCIVQWPLELVDAWGTSCGGISGFPWGVGVAKPGVAEAQLGPMDSAPDGWIELDPNLSVNPNP